MGISNPKSFHDEAQFQRVCAVCRSPGSFEAHHVVSRQELRKRGLVHLNYDPRNALRLCQGGKRCHMNHEHGGVTKVVIPTEVLKDENICFIWRALGVAGQNYLERHYTGIDRRYTLHEAGRCPKCQT